jgi:hypothetical protein
MTTKDFNQIAYKTAQSLAAFIDSTSPDRTKNIEENVDYALEQIRAKTITCIKHMHKLKDTSDTRVLRIDDHGNFYLGDK